MNRILHLAAAVAIIGMTTACQPTTTGGSAGSVSAAAPSTPATYRAAPGELSLDPAAWNQNRHRNSSLQPRLTNDGLKILGADWTNGQIRNGRLDGNGFSSSSRHNFVGRTTQVEFAVNGGGEYMAINIAPHGLPAHFFSTHNSWDGSRILPQNDTLVMALKIEEDGKWTQVVRDKSNGAIVASQGGRANAKQLETLRNAPFGVNFHDNHAGRNASVTVYRISGIETEQEIAAAKAAAAKAAAAPPKHAAKELPKSLDEPIKMLIAGFADAGAEKLRLAMSSLNRRDLLAISLTEVRQSLLRTNVKELETIVARVALAREAELAKAYDAAPEVEWKAALLKGRVDSLFFYGLCAARSNQPGAVAQAVARMRQILSQGDATGVPVAGLSGFPAMLTLAHGLLNGDNAAYGRYVADATLSAADRDTVATMLTLKQNEYMAPVLFLDMQKMRFILGKYAGEIAGVRGSMPKTVAFFDINGQPLAGGRAAVPEVAVPAAASAPAPAPSAPAGKVLD